MRAILNGLRYDTELAEAVYHWSNNSYPVDNFYFYEQTLYCTPKGRWFIHARGGAATDAADSCGNGWTSNGEKIEALSENEVVQFLESHGSDEDALAVYQKYFGDHLKEA